MSMFSFLTRRQGRRRQPQPYRFQPRLEGLEDRALLSTLTVLNTLDSGAGSLRDTIAAAASGDKIVFDGRVHGQTITLTSGELAIGKSLDIESPVANPVHISGNHASRVFDITSSSAAVTLSGLTITDGFSDQGGGIFNTGTLAVRQSTLSGDSAGLGGGIANFGTLTVSQSTLSGDSAQIGGAIFNLGTLTTTNSTLSGDSALKGGGIFNKGMLTVSQSTLSGNSASEAGGGVFNVGTATVSQSTLSGNSAGFAGGGIFTNGTLTLNNSTVCGNSSPSGADLFIQGFVSVTIDAGSTVCNIGFAL
jgi:hypothetical protein